VSLTTIVVADDHSVVRHGLRGLLEAEAGFSIVGEAADGLEAVRVVAERKPDVLIVDLTMPGLTGLEVTRQVKQRSPQTRVIILSMHADGGHVMEALRNGADGYVLKSADSTDVLHALREVTQGRRYLSRELAERAVEAYAGNLNGALVDPYEKLTTREREVLQLVAEGHNRQGIAERLHISPRTAEVHRANLMRKLGVRTQAELIRYAIRRGIVQAES
jgi:DNA-binding NarL/FixJ family response regulator